VNQTYKREKRMMDFVREIGTSQINERRFKIVCCEELEGLMRKLD